MAPRKGGKGGGDKFRVKGAARVLRALTLLDRDLNAKLRGTVDDYGTQLQDTVKFAAAFDTGFLAENVRKDIEPDGLFVEVGWRDIDFGSKGRPFYAPYVEFGTQKMAAQPALAPSLATIQPKFNAAIRRDIREAIGRSGPSGGGAA